MVETWFIIFWGMVATYAVLDGRNLGSATLRWFVAKDASERRQVLDAISPLWTWHEMWLVGSGGVLLLAFPSVLAAAFSGFYLELFLLLWMLILRGVSLEVRGHVTHPLWQTFWDVVLAGSSACLTALIGLAFGNIVRGVPLRPDGEFHMAFFSDFSVKGQVGLIDWYTATVAAFFAALLIAHGASFLIHKTRGPVHERSLAAAKYLWPTVLGLGCIVVAETRVVRPDLWAAFGSRPIALAFLAMAAASGAAILTGLRKRRHRLCYLGSCALIVSLLGARAAASFPLLLYSTLDPERSLNAYAAASAHGSLVVGLVWWLMAAPMAVLWGVLVARGFGGRTGPVYDTEGPES